MKKFFLLVALFFMPFISVKAYKDKVNSINIDIYIDQFGDAMVTELWDTDVASGTENYKQMLNLQTSRVTDFTVSDETGVTYQYVDYWNTNASYEMKRYKNGINHISNGIELCWGVSDYGHKIYVLKYKISNFVQQYNDAQGIYFGLVNKSDLPPKNVKITISSAYKFVSENDYVWGYGYKGKATIENGKLVFSGSNFKNDHYVTILVKLSTNPYSAEDKVNKNFEEILAQAEKGAKDAENNSETSFYKHLIIVLVAYVVIRFIMYRYPLLSIYFVLFFILPWPLFILVVIGSIIYSKNENDNRIKRYIKSIINITNIRPLERGEIIYNRDIPNNGDIDVINLIGCEYGLIKNPTGIIGAFILKWIKENKIKIVHLDKGILFKRKKLALDLNNLSSDIEEEKPLINLLKAASLDLILEENELKKWFKDDYTSYNNILANSIKQGALRLLEEGKIKERTDDVKPRNTSYNFIYHGQEYRNVAFDDLPEEVKMKLTQPLRNVSVESSNGLKKVPYVAKVSLQQNAQDIKAFRNYLLNFSRLDSKAPMDVKLWEDYLIVAHVLGISKQVEKQFKKLYPDFIETIKAEYDANRFVMGIMRDYRYFSRHLYTNERRRSFSRSFGGGGFSSFGGGGGSRGGGGFSGRR